MKKIFITMVLLALCSVSLRSAAANHPWNAHEFPGDTNRLNSGFSFGINMGAYFANKYNGNFYNGADGNVDSMGLVFNNYYYIQDIQRALNDTFRLLELPMEMAYQPALQFGFYVKYSFSNQLGVFMQFNYAKLKAKDVFTVGLGPEHTYLSQDDIVTYPIWGTEERIYIDLGVSKTFETSKTIQVFVEGGLNINNTRVKEHKIAIANLEYSLINIYGDSPYVPNTQMQTYETRLGGLGVGAFASGGLRFLFSNKISLDPGFAFYWTKTNLEGYPAYHPQYTVFLRLCFQRLSDLSQ
jgi:hypothetical protein